MVSKTIDAWHEVVNNRDTGALKELLAEDVVFHSPVVHTPQRGKAIVFLYLSAAMEIFSHGTFTYVREIIGENDALLEFTVELDGVFVNGVDMISWNEDGKITDFKVMLRPLQAVNTVHQKMAAILEAAQ